MVKKVLKFNFEAKMAIFALMCGMSLSIGLFIQDITLILLIILFFVLIGYFVFQSSLNLFEPFTLFTLYYFTIVIAALYLHLKNFEDSAFIDSTSFSHSLHSLFNISLIYYIFGYLFALWGYKTFVRSGKPIIDFEDGVSLKSVKLLVFPFALIGIINFAYNVYVHAGGNLFSYMQNISIRYLEFEKTGTTLGYLFAYVASYLWFYVLLKQRKKMSYCFLLFLVLTILMKASSGRVFITISYIISFIVIYYFVSMKFDEDLSNKNRRYVFALLLIGICGVIFYFFRITSSLMHNNKISSGWLATIIQFIDFDIIMNYAILKGNVPNIPVFMKIIDSWANDIGLLYGESLLTWIYHIIPSSFKPEGYQPSVMLKNAWYPHVLSGSLPPTGVGEMYANFGVLGPFIGMFLFGSFVAFLQNLLFRFNNYWYLVIYVQIAIGFVMIYPKGEFDNLTLWFVLPIMFTLLLIKLLQTSTKAYISK